MWSRWWEKLLSCRLARLLAGNPDDEIRDMLWTQERRGEFPKRRQLSPETVGWLSSEVETWIKRRTTEAI